MQWLLERDGPRFNFSIAKVSNWGPPTFKIGWGRRRIEVQCLDRDDSEQDGMLKDGEWLMDGKWLAFHRDRMVKPGYHPWWRWGVATGNRMWTVEIAGVNPDYGSADAVAIREADEAEWKDRRKETWGF